MSPAGRAALAIGLVAISAGSGFVTASLLCSPVLDVRTVRITGLHRVSPTLAVQAVEDAMPCPTNVILAASELERALERLPLVAEARAHRVFPNEIRLALREHVPVARVRDWSGEWVCDGGGGCLGTSVPDTAALPVIDLTAASLHANARAKKHGLVRLAVWVLEAAGATGIRQVKKVTVGDRGELNVSVGDRAWVCLGRPVDLAVKMQLASAALKRTSAGQGRVLVDVSDTQAAYFRPVTAELARGCDQANGE